MVPRDLPPWWMAVLCPTRSQLCILSQTTYSCTYVYEDYPVSFDQWRSPSVTYGSTVKSYFCQNKPMTTFIGSRLKGLLCLVQKIESLFNWTEGERARHCGDIRCSCCHPYGNWGPPSDQGVWRLTTRRVCKPLGICFGGLK